MRVRRRYLEGHLLCGGPPEHLVSLERRTRLVCVQTRPLPRAAFRSTGTGWDRLPLPALPHPPSWDVRRFCTLSPLPVRALLRRIRRSLAGTRPALVASADYELRAHLEGVHGSPTPAAAIPFSGGEDEFRNQVAFARIGLLGRPDRDAGGEGSCVVIFDSAPDEEPTFDPSLVDLYIPWPLVLDQDFPALRDEEEDEPEECAAREDPPPLHPPAGSLSDVAMRELRALHGVMIAALVRRIAPRSQIVLVRLMGPHLGALSYELIEAMRTVLALRDLGLLRGPLVYNLSLGVAKSQPETVQSCVLLSACDALARGGVVVVASVGNSSRGRPENPLEPAAYGFFGDTSWTRQCVVPVAASSYADPERYAHFSNEAHFACPGEDLILDCGRAFPWGRYVRWSGTSFAAGIASGIVSRLLGSGVPPTEVKQRLWDSCLRPSRWDGVHRLQVSG